MAKHTLLILFVLSISQAIGQTNYYVSVGGNDSNSGSFASPWSTIQHAANSVSPGDTVFIRTGTYHEKLELNISGSSTAPIVFSNYANETVIVDAVNESFVDGYGILTIHQKSNIDIVGLSFHNGGPHLNNSGIIIDECSNINVKNCHTYNTVSSGIGVWESSFVEIVGNDIELACNGGEQECITIANCSNFLVSNNIVHDSGPDLNGGEGIDVKQGSVNGEVSNNHVYNIKAVGVYVDAYNLNTSNITVSNNKIHDITSGLGGNQGIGIMLASEMGGLLHDIEVVNNLVYDCALFGMNISDCCIANHPIEDIHIINNTIFNNGYNSSVDGGGILVSNPQIQNIVIRNNIFSQNNLFELGISESSIENALTVDHNLFDGYTGIPGEITGQDFILSSPEFVNSSLSDFELLPSSPAIDQGSPTNAPATDYNGSIRPQGLGYDIGAYEAGSTSVPSTQLLDGEGLFLFPNPTSGETRISGSEMILKNIYTFEVISPRGRMIKRDLLHSNQTLHLSDLSRGVYFLRFLDENGKLLFHTKCIKK